jgi:hypothetical protein
MPYPLEVVVAQRLLLFLFLLSLAGLWENGSATGQISGPRVKLQSSQTPQAGGTSPTNAPPGGLRCPPAGPPMSQRGASNHKVILSWNASAPSPNADSNAVGYCLYRSRKRGAAKQKPTCDNCEQINPVPVVGTSCLDDVVEDSVTYFYVVTAINAKGRPSAPSNEARATIPSKKQSSIPAGSVSAPACRGASNATPTP